MTVDNGQQQLRLGGLPIAEVLVRDRQVLERALLEAIRSQIPEYQLLPTEALTGDVAGAIGTTLRLFVSTLRTHQPPSEDELAVLRESAARRAEEGIPVAAVLGAYHLGFELVWEHIAGQAADGEVAELMAASRLILHFLRLVAAAVSTGYLEERQVMFDDEHAARHAMLSALLEGEPPDEAAQRAGLRLPPAYQVLGVAVGPHPDELATGVNARVAARRKVRRLRVELDRRTGEPVLVALVQSGGVVLLPMPVPVEALGEQHHEKLAATVRALGRAAGADVTVAVVAAAPPAVAAAAALAKDVLDVAVAHGNPPGLYRLEDVLVEFHLSRVSAATPRLAALLEPLTERPELRDTLLCFLRSGQNRRRTASTLHLHPNTVDYRLRRVAELTGLDPPAARDAIAFQAALTAQILPRPSGAG